MTPDFIVRPCSVRRTMFSEFDCGKQPLNDFLRRFALENRRSGKSRTYVATRGEKVVAFCSLAPGGVAPVGVPARIAKGQGSQDMPVILLARLAVEGAEVIGGRAVLVHAQDDQARYFYQRYGFEASPTDDLHLLMLVKDLRRTFGM